MLNQVDLNYKIAKLVMPYAELIKIARSPYQRDEKARAGTPKVDKSLSVLRPEHLEIAIAELTEDAYDEDDNFYPKGKRFINNGNTRVFYWENGRSDCVPKTVNATIYYCKDMTEVRQNYNTFDSPNAVEANAEKIAGIIRGTFNFTANSAKVKKGNIFTALSMACHFYDSIIFTKKTAKPDNVIGMIGIFIEEIKAFDKICVHPENWDQPLICAALMTLKKYGVKDKKVNECLINIDRDCKNTSPMNGQWDGVTNIREEWVKGGKMFSHKYTNWDVPQGSQNCGLKWTVSFALYWIEKYLRDETGYKVGRGWEKTGDNFFKASLVGTTQTLNQFLDLNVVPMKVSNG
jgi:hypothetical protein